MVTAEGQKKDILEVAKAGVSNYIVKPFTPETLRERESKRSLKNKTHLKLPNSPGGSSKSGEDFGICYL